jgi:hypothetical protein
MLGILDLCFQMLPQIICHITLDNPENMSSHKQVVKKTMLLNFVSIDKNCDLPSVFLCCILA